MERKKASDFPPELLELFDRYVHGDLDRRGFLDGAKRFATGGLTATALWESLRPNYAWAQQVPKDDARIATGYETVSSPQGNGSIRGYLVRPVKPGPWPAVLVVHENRGLNPYIEDVARRLAVANFMALAPDGLSPVGGYPGDDDKGREMQSKLDRDKLLQDFLAGANYLKSHPRSTGKVGVVGFCYGGGVSNALAVRMPDLAAAVPFYGGQPTAEEAEKVRTPLLIHYASTDERINAGWPAYEAVLEKNNVDYTMHMYEGTNHGFHNDTTPRFDKEAADLAWSRTIEFFNKHLR